MCKPFVKLLLHAILGLLPILLILICQGQNLLAAESYTPGFRTLGYSSTEGKLRLDLNIWYPSKRPARDLQYPPWSIVGARNAKPAEGRFPLLLLSHGTSGSRFAHHNLAARLASLGFVVAAPNHSRDFVDNMEDLYSWDQLQNRARDLTASIDILLGDKNLGSSIDPKRIGLIGLGAGASTALLLGGALPSCSTWKDYCAKATSSDHYCTPKTRKSIDSLCRNFPLKKSLADSRLKAIAALAPAYGMIFDKTSFRYFYPPLLLLAYGLDKLNPPALHAQAINEYAGNRAKYLGFAKADAALLHAPCPPGLAFELPEICLPGRSAERSQIQAQTLDALADFFLEHLGNSANIPQIPAPPALEAAQPAEIPEPAPEQPVRKRRSR